MSSIKNLSAMQAGAEKIYKSNKVSKLGADGARNARQSAGSAAIVDRADISSKAQEMLRLQQEAAKHLPTVESGEELTREVLAAAREKVASNYYDRPEVVEKIVAELLRMQQFLPEVGDDAQGESAPSGDAD